MTQTPSTGARSLVRSLSIVIITLILGTAIAPAQNPVIAPGQSFSLTENSSLGSFNPLSLSSGSAESFAIESGNEAGNFSITSVENAEGVVEGIIEVTPGADLDFEDDTKNSFTLGVVAIFGSTPSAEVEVTISVTDFSELNVNESANEGTNLFTLTSDGNPVVTAIEAPAAGSFAITDGNGSGDGIFTIDPATGVISLADPSQLDHETTDLIELTITVTEPDDTETEFIIPVNVINDDEAPVFDAITLPIEIDENSTGTVATVTATDPEGTSTITYEISSIVGSTSTDANEAFEINASTGVISVKDASLIDYELFPPDSSFTLIVKATEVLSPPPGDGDPPAPAQTLELTIDLTDIEPEALIVNSQAFVFKEDSDPIGTLSVINAEGRSPKYSILSQIDLVNGSVNYFRINEDTGVITLNPNSVSADFTINNPFTVRVKVDPPSKLTGEVAAEADITLQYVSEKVPGGTPFLLAVTESLVDLAPGDVGETYALVRQSGGNLQIRIYDSGYARQDFITLPDTSSEITVESIAVTPQFIVVSADDKIYRYDRADPKATEPVSATLGFSGHVRDMVVKEIGGTFYVYVCGKNTSSGRFFWQRHLLDDPKLARDGNTTYWGFTTGIDDFQYRDWWWPGGGFNTGGGDITATANYKLFSMAVDSSGNAYVAGTFIDPIHNSVVGDSRTYGVSVTVPGTNSSKSLLMGRGSYRKTFVDEAMPAKPRRETGFIYKFTAAGDFERGSHDAGSNENSFTRSFVRDLEITEENGQSSIYAVMQFSGPGILGAGDTPAVGYLSTSSVANMGLGTLKIMRFDSNLDTSGTDALVRMPDALSPEVDERELSLTVDPQQNIYLMARAPGAKTVFTTGAGAAESDPEISPDTSRYYLAKLNSARAWQWIELFGLGQYVPQTSHPASALVRWHGSETAALFGANLQEGTFTLQDGNDVNSINQKAFFSLITSGQELIGSKGLTIVSEFGDSGVHVLPFKGTKTQQRGDTIEVKVPETIYFEEVGGTLRAMGSLDEPPSQNLIRENAVMRARCTGYTVADISGESQLSDFSDPSNTYTFVFDRSTKITFNWQVEYALTITSDLSGTGAQEGANRGEWVVGDAGNGFPGLGLTSTAAADPNPTIKKHWVIENELVTAFIDGKVDDLRNIGTRYLIDGWETTGSAIESNSPNGVNLQARHQVPQFVMDGPATIDYQWRIQHRVQVSTSNTLAEDAPQVRDQANGYAAPTEGANGFGSNEHWYDRESTLRIGSLASYAGKDLTGWVTATAPFTPASSPNSLDGLSAVGSFTYLQHNSLTAPIRVAWNYNDTIYRNSTPIGNRADLVAAVADGAGTLGITKIETSPGSGEIRKPDNVTVVDSPPGSTGNDMQVWDEVAHQLLPLRPGVFFLEWDVEGSDTKTVVEVTSEFPEDAHFTQLYAPDIPSVTLDPDPGDSVAFIEQKFTDGNANTADGVFTSSENGRAVLLFTRSDTAEASGGSANGDNTRETYQVRVVETIVWDESMIGSFIETPIGSPIPSFVEGTEYDTADIGTGFVVYGNARYNPSIHDRTKVADAGPVIPVNRHFELADPDDVNRQDLVVFWYEKKNAILWPYSSIKYIPVWPAAVGRGTIDPPEIDGDYLRRIVIASRLGSEGKDTVPRDQMSFSPDRFSNVRIYHQPDKSLPGYNPNEEHALIAPSFKFLDQANPPPAAYALRRDLNLTVQGPSYTSDPFVLVEYFDNEAGENGAYRMAVYAIDYEDLSIPLEVDQNGRAFPYIFDYPMVAGEPVQPPYPLDRVIGLTPCEQTFGFDLGPQKTYWEDHRGQPWAISDGALATHFYYPQALDFWNGETPPGTCIPFVLAGSIEASVTGKAINPFFEIGDQFFIGEHVVTLDGDTPDDFVRSLNRVTAGLPDEDEHHYVTAQNFGAGVIKIEHSQAGRIILRDGPGRPLSKAGLSYTKPGVTYRVTWPEETPVLKAGETLTFAGGEWKADHPDAPGLPGVVGWAAGTVVFDSLNPTMDAVAYFNQPDNYTARLIAPLETLSVDLPLSAEERTNISPTTGLTEVDSTIWRFTGLSASLQKRVFYNPLDNELGIVGFVNDKTLGDSSLTAAPAPVYVLEPNILSESEKRELLALEGFADIDPWSIAVEELFSRGRDPENLRPGAPGYFAGLISDTLSGGLFTANDIVTRADANGDLEGAYFLLYHPDNPVWVLIDSAAANYTGEVHVVSPQSIDVGPVWWEWDKWVGEDDVVTHQVLFTSGALNGRSFDITNNGWNVIDLDTNGGNLDTMGLEVDDTFRIVEKKTGSIQPGIAGSFTTLTVSELPENASANDVAKSIASVINGSTTGYRASAVGPRISVTYNDGPAAPRDGNSGFSFPESENDSSDGSTPRPGTATPATLLGPGLALVPGAKVLDPSSSFSEGYVTIAENNDPDLGGPVSLTIVKVSKEHRYRGAIKTILPDNIFEEKVTLRHTGDFGANADKMVYQWFYREEDGTETLLPPNAAWKIFPDQSDNVEKGKGMYQISLEGTGGLLLADNLFFVRYRHENDDPEDGMNSVKWGPADSNPSLATEGTSYTDWWNDGKPPAGESIGELFAGAGNSPSVDGDYKPQLVQGWIKRVLDRINPFEARFNDFRSNDVPATYVSMIQQTGPPYLGPVALNPDKNVIENVGLLELYHTVFDRGTALSIDLSSPINTPGVNNALLLASSRLSDLYMLLGNEAYADAVDPTIGFGSNSAEYGHATPSIFAFQNQMGSLLDEELSLLRGVDESFARPVFNRLFWNFTKNDGEVAYALNYNITDQNVDGFIDESDAMILYPQGHGDAWGHYLSAMRQQYLLLKHPFFNWVSRSEQYNLLDIVISVDFEDERKFATAAAAKAKAGADIVEQTYRSRYVADPDGQWQGYADPDESRGWGVQGWARRAGQGALFDWVAANAILPDDDTRNEGLVNESLKKIDRKTVTSISQISGHHGKIQGTYDNANLGLNPLGLSDEVVPFDIDPRFVEIGSGIQGQLHFEQIYERAIKASANALRIFDAANEHANRVRQQQVTADDFYEETYEQDRTYRNDLIAIFGSPYEGTIGPGLPYPSGYSGPDLNLFFYVDVADVNDRTVPSGSGTFAAAFSGFTSSLEKVKNESVNGNALYQFESSAFPFFVNDVLNSGDFADGLASNLSSVINMTQVDDDGNLFMNLPLTADDYVFQAPSDWGRRASPGELQAIISEMLIAEAELALAQGDYDNYIKELVDLVELLEAKSGLNADIIKLKTNNRDAVIGLNAAIQSLRTIAALLLFNSNIIHDVSEASADSIDVTVGFSNTPFKPVTGTIKAIGATTQYFSRIVAFAFEQTADIIEISKEARELNLELDIDKATLTFEIQEQIKEIEQHLRNEATTRIEIFTKIEALREVSDRYRTTLERGLALLQEREDFNKSTAATTQQTRYQDMAFRLFRNSSLEKYHDSFDLAARYTYLAAKAYDYDTNLSPDDPASARGLLDDIVKARHLGGWSEGEPRVGSGLAGALAVMRDNFDVHKSQLGLNNVQQEVSKLSLREGHFRNKKNLEAGSTEGAISNAIWRQVLQEGRKANLWEVPEFRQYCRPPQAESQGALPGIVLEFPTEVIFGNNVFGWPLGGGDFAYDPTNFATKIRAAGVWFEGYDNAALAVSPRVYLVPAGSDIMTIPNSNELEARVWNVVDQSIPPPFLTGDADIQNPDFIPMIDSIDGPFAEIRKFSSFRAYGDTVGTPPDQDQMTFDSRLVGRSVWNTKWLLIIPGGTLLNDGDEGLDRFIQDVSDIKLYFNTLGYSGN